MPDTPGVVVLRFPAGQSLDLHTAVGGLLNAALETVGVVYLTASDAPGTSASITLAGEVPERVVVDALRVAAMQLTADPAAREEMAQHYRDLTALDDEEDDPALTLNRLTANADGSVTFGLGGSEEVARAAAQWTIAQFLPYFRETRAPNYLSWPVVDAETGDRYEISITKPDGMSPHQARKQAEAENERLRAELETLRADLMEARNAR